MGRMMGERDERKRKRWRCGGKGKGWEREKGPGDRQEKIERSQVG